MKRHVMLFKGLLIMVEPDDDGGSFARVTLEPLSHCHSLAQLTDLTLAPASRLEQ